MFGLTATTLQLTSYCFSVAIIVNHYFSVRVKVKVNLNHTGRDIVSSKFKSQKINSIDEHKLKAATAMYSLLI